MLTVPLFLLLGIEINSTNFLKQKKKLKNTKTRKELRKINRLSKKKIINPLHKKKTFPLTLTNDNAIDTMDHQEQQEESLQKKKKMVFKADPEDMEIERLEKVISFALSNMKILKLKLNANYAYSLSSLRCLNSC